MTAPLPRSLDCLSREELIDELRAIQEALDTLRTCTDRGCGLCARCVVALFVTARPAPGRIAAKYVELPWRKP
jgi:hypothetical protein